MATKMHRYSKSRQKIIRKDVLYNKFKLKFKISLKKEKMKFFIFNGEINNFKFNRKIKF